MGFDQECRPSGPAHPCPSPQRPLVCPARGRVRGRDHDGIPLRHRGRGPPTRPRNHRGRCRPRRLDEGVRPPGRHAPADRPHSCGLAAPARSRPRHPRGPRTRHHRRPCLPGRHPGKTGRAVWDRRPCGKYEQQGLQVTVAKPPRRVPDSRGLGSGPTGRSGRSGNSFLRSYVSDAARTTDVQLKKTQSIVREWRHNVVSRLFRNSDFPTGGSW